MHTRRHFLQQTALAAAALQLQAFKWKPESADGMVMTVAGPINPDAMHFTLTHEHVLADFIGADNYSKSRYNPEEVYSVALPFLTEVRKYWLFQFCRLLTRLPGAGRQIAEAIIRIERTKYHNQHRILWSSGRKIPSQICLS